MASKKYKNKTCPYCAERPSTTEDHIFARQFFLVQRRANLPKVPACRECNGLKSRVEHYVMSVLPFGAVHADALEILNSEIPRRMEKNRKLQVQLQAGMAKAWVEHSSVIVPTSTLPVDPEQIQTWMEFVVRGLVWHHFGTLLPPANHFVNVMFVTAAGEEVFQRNVMGLNAKCRVQDSLGGGTFDYEGVQAETPPEVTAWRFRIMGGAVLSGDPKQPNEPTSQIIAFTGHRRILSNAARRLYFGAV